MSKKFNIKKLDFKTIAIRAAGVGGGAYVACKVNKVEAIGKMKPEIRGAVKMAVGALLPAFLKVKDPSMQAGLQGAGDGLVAIGALEVASKFDTSLPVISGTSDVMGNVLFDESYTASPMNGTDDTMGGTDDLRVTY